MAKSPRKRAVRSDKVTFTKRQIAQVESLAGVGMTMAEIADYFGVSKATLDRRVGDTPELADALRKGRTRAHGNVLKAAYEMATDKKHSDFTKFYLRSRYGWSEKQELHVTGDVLVNPEHAFVEKLKTMTTEELADFVTQGRKTSGE